MSHQGARVQLEKKRCFRNHSSTCMKQSQRLTVTKDQGVVQLLHLRRHCFSKSLTCRLCCRTKWTRLLKGSSIE